MNFTTPVVESLRSGRATEVSLCTPEGRYITQPRVAKVYPGLVKIK